MDKAEQLQTLVDLTIEQINDIVYDAENLSALELFKISTENAIAIYIQIGQKDTLPLKKNVIWGKVDTTKVAFCLQDNETAAVIQGDLQFAEDTELDYIGGDQEPNLDDY